MTDFDPNLKQAIINEAVQAQYKAADPAQSVWVSANAGTGKTRVLTNRILRLLINGAAVTDILAVTYTRAAAAEMRDRLFATLARWAVIAETDLTSEIANMGIPRPSQDQIKRGRQLFAHLLDQPTGVRIETVHAFAQSVLRRFPLEAGVQPYFDLASDDQIRMLKTQAQAQILTSADPLVTGSLLSLGQHIAENQMVDLTSQMLAFPDVLAMARSNPVGLKTRLFDALGVRDAAENPEASKKAIAAEAAANLPDDQLQRLIRVCREGNATEQKFSNGLANWMGLDEDKKPEHFMDLVEVFLTQKGEARSNIPSKKNLDSYPDLAYVFQRITAHIQTVLKRLNGIDVAMLTYDLYMVSSEMASGYHRRKTDVGLMDYDDLIHQTIRLLQQDGGASWVRYKLDRGLKYLLIDEAQDTSPEQWQILTAIATEFFVDNTEDQGQTPDRSLFSVGDFKQSIYSFQGARPELFQNQRQYFQNLSGQAHKPFAEVPLNTSFRTAAPILQLVDEVAGLDGGLIGLGDDLPQHPVARSGDAGFVEILDPIQEEKEDNATLEAFTVADGGSQASAEQRLAVQIAEILKSWIGQRVLPAKGRVMRPGDIMILLKKRDRFGLMLDRELRLAGLPLAGADRVKMLDHVAVMDLIALGHAMLLPEDDLTLAAVLKSPLLGLDEDHLFALAHNRGEASLMQQLAQFAAENEDPIYAEAHGKLTAWLGLAETLTPYEFYQDVLTTDQRLAFIKRLGAPVIDILAEFLNILRDFETVHPPSLQLFLTMIKDSDLEVTRDGNANNNDEIRIMTIHGSKGLESPVVILPDMLLASSKSDPLISLEHEGMMLPVKSVANEFTPEVEPVAKAKQKAKEKSQEEANRLLYVALTRAEEGVLIAGFEASRKRKLDGSWYQICRTALERLEGTVPRPDGNGISLSTPQLAPPQDDHHMDGAKEADPITAPSWLHQHAPVEETPPRPLSPSRYQISDGGASPSGQTRQLAMLRGTITHRLLEILPGLDGDQQTRAAARIFAPHPSHVIDDAAKDKIIKDVMGLLSNPDLANIFDDNARVEVPISGRVGDHIVSGVIDRLLITDDQVMIIDFKTGQPPQGQDDISPDYINQMAIYRHVLGGIYPSHSIKAGLVYTENAAIHWADEKTMDMVIERLLTSTS